MSRVFLIAITENNYEIYTISKYILIEKERIKFYQLYRQVKMPVAQRDAQLASSLLQKDKHCVSRL